MRYINPLATVQHMGGSIIIHITMALRGVVQIVSFVKMSMSDEKDHEEYEIKFNNPFGPEHSNETDFNDIFLMIFAHVVCALFMTMINHCSDRHKSRYLHDILNLASMIIYIMSILYMHQKVITIYWDMSEKDETKKKIRQIL